jgi:hypothetical protein
MIGVAAREAELTSVAEFFELFKTPWEPLVAGKCYDAVLIADGRTEPVDACVALIYGSDAHPCDARLDVRVQPATRPNLLRWNDSSIPVYGRITTFHGTYADQALSCRQSPVSYRAQTGMTTVRRFGYDVFGELSCLVSDGQPVTSADVPTLEMHIALLRQCLEEEGIAVVEIPPQPYGCNFLCCLTHDVDFFGIRRHRADRTLAGFVWRGTFGAAIDAVRGRRPLREALRNVVSVLSLPLVFLGVARDFWHPFDDYAGADRGHPSTFFLVPFKNRPGVSPQGVVERHRSVAYDVRDIEADVKSAGPHVEFAVHGLDAWRDPDAGRDEAAAVAAVTGRQTAGVRMHWLYFDKASPRHLEDAGFEYDSTRGYNDAVGFRAGTLQAFRLPGTKSVLELPLSIMDSALFFPDRMGLTRDEAWKRCRHVIQQARRFGGALVINWHDRSLAPERQWGRFYDDLLREVEAAGGHFTTASDAVSWFRWRRGIRFSTDASSGAVTVEAAAPGESLPAARLAVRRHTGVEESVFRGGPRTVTRSAGPRCVTVPQ